MSNKIEDTLKAISEGYNIPAEDVKLLIRFLKSHTGAVKTNVNITGNRPINTIFTDPKTGHHVGLGDFGEDGLPRYAACWTDRIPLMPEKVVNRNPNVNWDLVEEMFGPEEDWITKTNKDINFSDCIFCGKFLEHDHRCEDI